VRLRRVRRMSLMSQGGWREATLYNEGAGSGVAPPLWERGALASGGVGYSYENLTPAEKALVWRNPFTAWHVRMLAQIAANEAYSRSPEILMEDGPGDAFRHAYWTALMTRSLGAELAKQFSDAHELGATGNSPEQRKMDLDNNKVGIKIGAKYRTVSGVGRAIIRGTPQDVARDVWNAYMNHQLTWIWP